MTADSRNGGGAGPMAERSAEPAATPVGSVTAGGQAASRRLLSTGVDEVDAVDENALLEWVRSGDPAALDAFFRAFHGRIYGWCLTALRHPQDAEEAASQVLMAVTRTRLAGAEALTPYVRRMALNACASLLRSRGRSFTDEPVGDELGDPAEMSAEVLADLGRDELRALVWRAMAGLSPRDRFLFEAEWRDGLEGRQLAELAGTSQPYVVLNRMRRQVAAALGAALVAWYGRRDCPELDRIVAETVAQTGREMSPLLRKRVNRHINGTPRMAGCATCQACRDRWPLPVLGTALPIFPVPEAVGSRLFGEFQAALSAGSGGSGSLGVSGASGGPGPSGGFEGNAAAAAGDGGPVGNAAADAASSFAGNAFGNAEAGAAQTLLPHMATGTKSAAPREKQHLDHEVGNAGEAARDGGLDPAMGGRTKFEAEPSGADLSDADLSDGGLSNADRAGMDGPLTKSRDAAREKGAVREKAVGEKKAAREKSEAGQSGADSSAGVDLHLEPVAGPSSTRPVVRSRRRLGNLARREAWRGAPMRIMAAGAAAGVGLAIVLAATLPGSSGDSGETRTTVTLAVASDGPESTGSGPGKSGRSGQSPGGAGAAASGASGPSGPGRPGSGADSAGLGGVGLDAAGPGPAEQGPTGPATPGATPAASATPVRPTPGQPTPTPAASSPPRATRQPQPATPPATPPATQPSPTSRNQPTSGSGSSPTSPPTGERPPSNNPPSAPVSPSPTQGPATPPPVLRPPTNLPPLELPTLEPSPPGGDVVIF